VVDAVERYRYGSGLFVLSGLSMRPARTGVLPDAATATPGGAACATPFRPDVTSMSTHDELREVRDALQTTLTVLQQQPVVPAVDVQEVLRLAREVEQAARQTVTPHRTALPDASPPT